MLAWVPGKAYYTDGMAPAVLAAGSVAAERWIARGRRPRFRRGAVIAAPLRIQLGVCTGPVAGWRSLWPHLRHYG